jgi:membrane associated rhomboid family serine protease
MLPKIFDFLKGDYRKSIFFTAALIIVPIGFGSVNQVAPLVTIFYLLCYGGVNICCFLLDWLGSPNWRPKWKYYHKSTAFMGALLCIACMIIISWWASLAAICGSLIIYAYLDRKS